MTKQTALSRKKLIIEADRELVRRSIPGAMAYSLLLLVIAWFTPYRSDHPWVLAVTWITLTALGIGRIILARDLLRSSSETPSILFRVGVFANAAVWALFSALTVSYYDEQWTTMVVLLMTAGISAGGLTSLSPDLLLARSYLLAILVPSIIAAVVNGGPEGNAVALTVSIYAAFLIAESGHQNTSYWQAIEDHAALRVKAAELEEAKRAADAATIAKSSFLANMSHEIRTPMNAVIGLTELLLDSKVEEPLARNLRSIKDASESLLAIVNDILDVSKIEAGKLGLDSTNFSLRDGVHDLLQTLALRAHSKGLEVSCRIGTDVPDALYGDAGRLRQILVNLVGNAIKFTSKGSILVHAELEKKVEQGVVLKFSVKDTGIGILEAKHQMIFAPFTQADTSTTRKYGGSGLGLSISKTLVEMMDGTIWLESEEGKGSTFYFTVRFGIQAAPERRLSASGVGTLQDRSILVVAADPATGRILVDMVKNWRMNPTLVEDSKSAMDALAEIQSKGDGFDFVLIDAQLKGGDGFELAMHAMSGSVHGIPIMMLRSTTQNSDAVRCIDLGLPVYILKPVSESNVFDALMTTQGFRVHGTRPQAPIRHRVLRKMTDNLRILLVEDNAMNQLVAKGMLESLGHEISVASNGREALEHFAEEPPFNVVLMDIQMPEMDGFQATAAIREIEKTRSAYTPIVAMTAHAMKGDRERCLAAGMDAYVPKPLQAHALSEAIKTAILETFKFKSSPDPEKGPTAFDGVAFLQRVGNDPAMARSAVKLFMEDCPRQMAHIRKAIEESDGKSLAAAAHTLRGSLMILAADVAAAAAQKLESMGRAGEPAGAPESLAVLDLRLEELNAELLAWTEQLV